MKKRILAAVLALSMVFSFLPFNAFAADTADTTITFELGTDGSASHADGSSKTSYSETVDSYTLSITDGTNMYTGARDLTGNGCIKLGTSKKVGGFNFTVPDDVTSVIINVAKYKTNTSIINVNGTAYTLTSTSDSGEYDAIEVDTSSNKDITFTTVSGGIRAMVNSIVYVISASGSEEECAHSYMSEITTAATCTETGVETFTCSLCGSSYTKVVDATGHSWSELDEVAPNGTEAGYKVSECTVCNETKNHDYFLTAPDGTEKVVFEFGDNGSPVHTDGSAISAPIDYTSGDYTLTFDSLTKAYAPSYDATGNSVIKLGTGSATAALEFTVPQEVSAAVIYIAGYKSYSTEFIINDNTTYTVGLGSDGGEYYPIYVDTTSNKTVALETTATIDERALIDTIEYWIIPSDCEHSYTSKETTAPTCTDDGVMTYTCTSCGDSYTEAIDALGHEFVAGEVVTSNGTVAGYTIYECSNCDATENRDFTATAPEGLEEIVFEFGDDDTDGSTAHVDGSTLKTTTEFTSTNGAYTLAFDALTKVYSGSFDAKGNSAIKLGTSSASASLTFTVPENVSYAVIRIAGYKANTVAFTVNDGDEQTVTLASDNGAYMPIIIDTTETKTITLTTTSNGYRAMIDSITYWGTHVHKYTSNVTEPTCTEDGYTTYTCYCGDSYTSDATPAGHNYESVTVAPSATDTGYTQHTCSGCGDSYVSDPVLIKNGKVQNVAASTDGDTVTVTWDALTAVNKYIVYVYATDGTLVKCVQRTTNSAALTGLDVGEYVVLVIAKTTNGWSNYLYADEVPFTILEEEADTEKSPSASVGEITPNYVTITWPEVEGAVKYTVMIVGNGKTIYRAAYTNTAYVYGLEPSTEYKVYINAKTTKYLGYGEACVINTASVSNATITIQTLNPTSVVFAWDAVANAEKYFIMLKSDDETKYYSTTSTSFKLNGLEIEKSYTAYINTRIAGKNYSGYTSSVSFTTPATEGVFLSSEVKADGVRLSWTSGLPFDKVWVKEILSDGTEIQHAALSDGAANFTVDVFEEGTRQFYLIVRVQTESGRKYVNSNTISVTAPTPKEVEAATEDQLRAALAAAQVGEIVRITLTADIDATLADVATALFSVPKSTDVILNLNGHTINATLPDNTTAQNESVFIINQDATLAVEGNGTINTSVGTNGAGSYIFNNTGATLLIVDGNYSLTLEEGKKGLIIAIVDSNSTLGETKTTIIDGYFKTSDNIGNMFRNFANHSTETCSLIIEGGTFVSEYTSTSYPKAVFWNQSANTNAYGTGYVSIVRGSFSGLEVENEHPAENVTISKKAFIGVYGTATYVENAEELKNALANGGYIVVNGDIDLSAADSAEITGNVISENTVLDLNGNTISYVAEYVSGMNGTQISAITVDNGATLVIGNGTVDADSAYGIYVKDGGLVIESGSYSAATSAVQVYNGKATINGGSFEGSATYLLNCIDSAYNSGEAEIVVNGGSFVGFNPADNAAETGGHTNFVAEGYTVIEENGTYIVNQAQ